MTSVRTRAAAERRDAVGRASELGDISWLIGL
jgi:hypothetical protein